MHVCVDVVYNRWRWLAIRPLGPVSKDFDILFEDMMIDTKRIGPAL